MENQVECTGPREPEWMETLASIDETARVYRAKVPAILARTGHCVLGAYTAGVLTCLEDRSTGVVLNRFTNPQTVGAILRVSWRCATNGRPEHIWPQSMQILRKVTIREVRKMAALYGGPVPIQVPHGGHWYHVHTD